MQIHWRVELFGGLRATREDQVVSRFRTQKTGLLLAYLAYHRQGPPQQREALIEMLWPESDLGNARRSLRVALTWLRHSLEPPGPGPGPRRCPLRGQSAAPPSAGTVLLADRATVQLNPAAVTSDVAEFEANLKSAARARDRVERAGCLARAVELYRGELLAGYYDGWVLQEREWLAERYFQALGSLIADLAETGDLSRALEYARRGLSLDRLREETHVALMRLYAAAGQPAAALRQYRELESLLQQELESTPSAAARALAREIEGLTVLRVAARPVEVLSGSPGVKPPANLLRPSGAARAPEGQQILAGGETPGAGRFAAGENRLVTLLAVRIRDRGLKATPLPTGGEAAPLPRGHWDAAEHRLLQAMEDAVLTAAGHVERSQGEELRAAFGLFQAHEDDAERAVQAALAIRDAARKLGLEIAAGIHTGEVTVGAERSPIADESPVAHEASRLQQEAEPGQILVSAPTYHLTRRAFAFSFRSQTWDPSARPAAAYVVEGALSRPEKPYGLEGRSAPLIGREEELARLQRALTETLVGEGQIVCLTGEAGLGKSRLVAELKRAALSLPPWLEGRCLPLGRTARFWPFLDLLRQYLGWGPEDDEPTRAEHLVAALQALADCGALAPERVEEIGPLLGHLLSLHFGTDWDGRLQHAGPEQIRHQSLLALQAFLAALARRKPLALVLEDLHWADPHSLDLISLLMETLAEVPLLLLCVYRPEREHGCWRLGTIAAQKCAGRFTELSLRELPPAQSRRLVAALLDAEGLPPSVTDRVQAKAGGNPLFVEEVVRSLVATELLSREGETWRVNEGVEAALVAPTVQSIIQSRVDRLGGDLKEVLQQAAVIGRLFRSGLLAEVTREPGELPWALRALEEEQLVYQERVVPEEEYAFHHVLTQEAVYSSIPPARRAHLHERVGEALERLAAGDLEAHYEELAHHYEHSEADEKAIEYLLKVGEKARRAYLNEEAIGCLKGALKRLEGSPLWEARKDWRLLALRGLGQIYHGTGKLTEADIYLREAIVLGQEIGLARWELVRLYFWLGDLFFWQSRNDEMVQVGEEGLALLGADTESVEAALMNQTIAMGHSMQGHAAQWQEFTHRTMRFLSRLPYSEELRVPYTHVVSICGDEKKPEEALAWAERLERLAQQHHDLRALAEADLHAGAVLHNQGDLHAAAARQQQAVERFARIGEAKLAGWCLHNVAETFLSLGDLQHAEEYAGRSREVAEATGSTENLRRAAKLIGFVSLSQGAWDAAIDACGKAAQLAHELGALWASGGVIRAIGRAHLARGEPQAAVERFREALALARANPFPLAAALSGLEQACNDVEEYRALCRRHRKEYPEADASFSQWFLEPGEALHAFRHPVGPALAAPLSPTWSWQDPFGDCAFSLQNGLEIRAANGRDLWDLNWSAPRLTQAGTGDFVVHVICSPVSDEQPAIGGLLLWKDRENFLRLDRGTRGQHEISFMGCLGNEDLILGRGWLAAERAVLRLERAGSRVRALCSVDGETWFTVGAVDFPVADPIEVGVHAIGQIDRTMYPGAYPDGTAIRFHGFQVWR